MQAYRENPLPMFNVGSFLFPKCLGWVEKLKGKSIREINLKLGIRGRHHMSAGSMMFPEP